MVDRVENIAHHRYEIDQISRTHARLGAHGLSYISELKALDPSQ
jgi:hypothetical protein